MLFRIQIYAMLLPTKPGQNTPAIESILQAAQKLYGEIQLDKLLTALMQVVVENTQADKAALILNQQNCLEVAAQYINGNITCVQQALDSCTKVWPTTLFYTVQHTREAIVTNQSLEATTADIYLLRHQPACYLCAPILNRGKLIGILYLENTHVTDAFTHDRVELLQFLCSQVAISLENAHLYQTAQQAIQSLQQQEEQYRSIFEAIQDGLVIADMSTGLPLAANPAYCQMHQVSWAEIKTSHPTRFIHPESFPKFAEFMETLGKQQEFQADATCLRADGTPFAAHVKAIPFIYQGVFCSLAILRDMTEREQMQLTLQQQNQTLEQTLIDLQQAQVQMVQNEKMSALGSLVAGVAHEINNPTGFLSGNINPALAYIDDLFQLIDLYQQEFPQASSAIRSHLEEIDYAYLREDLPKLIGSMREGVKRIRDISHSLRTFSRRDSDQPVAFNIHEGLDSTLLILKHRLKGQQQQPDIKIVKEYGVIPTVECYAGQLNQVFMNILANAIDALEDQPNAKTITIQTGFSNESNAIQIRLKDNGSGMSEAVKAKIFDHLYTTKGVGKGTGLGLAIVHDIIVNKHHGQIAVQSELGQGTEFVITLPIVCQLSIE
jgi:PAS domain S-box-containing protein